jgi:hypothetical protein
MGKNRFGWHGKIRTAAVLSFSGLIITGCSLVPREPAPVYMLGATSTPTRPSMASAPMKRAMIAGTINIGGASCARRDSSR